jgi:hypothetical protein
MNWRQAHLHVRRRTQHRCHQRAVDQPTNPTHKSDPRHQHQKPPQGQEIDVTGHSRCAATLFTRSLHTKRHKSSAPIRFGAKGRRRVDPEIDNKKPRTEPWCEAAVAPAAARPQARTHPDCRSGPEETEGQSASVCHQRQKKKESELPMASSDLISKVVQQQQG